MNAEKPSILLNKVLRNSARKMARILSNYKHDVCMQLSN